MKKLALATLLTGLVAVPAFAETNNKFSDVSYIFDTSNQRAIQLKTLTQAEMESTQGAIAPLILVGLNLVGRVTTNQVFAHLSRSAGLAYGTYATARWLDD
jgi:hypothetical protein